MSVTISKEVDVELEFSDIRDAVNDLSSREQAELVAECDLLNKQVIIEYLENSDSDDLKEIAEKCDMINENVVVSYLDDLSEEDFKETISQTCHSELLGEGSEGDLTKEQVEFAKVCSKYLNKEQMKTIVQKHEDFAVILKAILGVVGK